VPTRERRCPATAGDLQQRIVSAHDKAETAAIDLRRIDDAIDGLPPGARRIELVRQRTLLEAQLPGEPEGGGSAISPKVAPPPAH